MRALLCPSNPLPASFRASSFQSPAPSPASRLVASSPSNVCARRGHDGLVPASAGLQNRLDWQREALTLAWDGCGSSSPSVVLPADAQMVHPHCSRRQQRQSARHAQCQRPCFPLSSLVSSMVLTRLGPTHSKTRLSAQHINTFWFRTWIARSFPSSPALLIPYTHCRSLPSNKVLVKLLTKPSLPSIFDVKWTLEGTLEPLSHQRAKRRDRV